MNTKTIDINCLEWFDKINGNSYFAGKVTVNYGMPDEKTLILPFQYGYGSQYQTEAAKELFEGGFIPNFNGNALWSYCRDNNIILRSHLTDRCKKAELTVYTKLHEQENKKRKQQAVS